MDDKEKIRFRKFLITTLEDFDQNKNVEIFATADKICDKVVNILPIQRVSNAKRKFCPICGNNKENQKDDMCMNCWQKYRNP